jgi:hypothetical protein
MFMQVFDGQARHAEPVFVELDQWVKEISRSAEGWVRSVAGVTQDKRFIGLGLWESAEAAQRNSSRPDQNHWWSAFTELFEEPPVFTETSDVMVDIRGDVEHAGFVQVMRGQGRDPGRARELMGSHREQWAALRPDVLGSVGGQFDNGGFVMATYFTDEAAARAGEAKTVPPELKGEMDELMSLLVGQPEFFDLRDPWLHAA